MMIYYTQILLHINQCNNCVTFNNLNKYKLHKKLFVHVTQVAGDPNIYKMQRAYVQCNAQSHNENEYIGQLINLLEVYIKSKL